MPDYLKIAEGFLESGSYSKAVEFAEKITNEDSNNFKGLEILGIAYFRLNKISSSIEFLKKSIQANSRNANAYYNLGLAFITLKDFENGLLNTNEALKLDKSNCDYLYQLALIYKRTNRINESIEVCTKILDAFPTDQSTLLLRSGIYLNQKEYKLAIEDYKKIRLKEKNKSTIYNNIGFCYSKSGDLGRAKTYLQLALETEPGMAYANNNLGFVYFQERNYSKALHYINESLDIDASNSYALKNRALIFISLNKYDEAIEDLKLALELGYSSIYDSEAEELLNKLSQNGSLQSN